MVVIVVVGVTLLAAAAYGLRRRSRLMSPTARYSVVHDNAIYESHSKGAAGFREDEGDDEDDELIAITDYR